jgi:hypothetical protein
MIYIKLGWDSTININTPVYIKSGVIMDISDPSCLETIQYFYSVDNKTTPYV